MAMNSINPFILSASAATIIITLLHFLSPASSSTNKPPHDATRGLLMEDKTRLGSTPPSCHNKCNQCHPCMAVQVPTLPSPHRVKSSSVNRFIPLEEFFDSSAGKRYSNYKPLGWKCRCDDHFFNP